MKPSDPTRVALELLHKQGFLSFPRPGDYEDGIEIIRTAYAERDKALRDSLISACYALCPFCMRGMRLMTTEEAPGHYWHISNETSISYHCNAEKQRAAVALLCEEEEEANR